MTIKQFIAENHVDKSDALVTVQMLECAERVIDVRFGEELTEYLLKYGYLGYEYIELYGMNARQGMKSDLVKQTLYLHQYFPATKNFVVIENQGDGNYGLVNSSDEVFEYDSEQDRMANTELSLFEYILKRFQSV